MDHDPLENAAVSDFLNCCRKYAMINLMHRRRAKCLTLNFYINSWRGSHIDLKAGPARGQLRPYKTFFGFQN